MRYVSITTYAKQVGISREAVYKRLKRGTAMLMEDCEVSIIDTHNSQGKMIRNDFSSINGKLAYKLDRVTGKVVAR